MPSMGTHVSFIFRGLKTLMFHGYWGTRAKLYVILGVLLLQKDPYLSNSTSLRWGMNQKNQQIYFHQAWPMPWKSKNDFFNGFSVKTIVLVRVYYQQILGNVILWSLTSRVWDKKPFGTHLPSLSIPIPIFKSSQLRERNDLLGHQGIGHQDPHRWRLPHEFFWEVERQKVVRMRAATVNINESSKYPAFQTLCQNARGKTTHSYNRHSSRTNLKSFTRKSEKKIESRVSNPSTPPSSACYPSSKLPTNSNILAPKSGVKSQHIANPKQCTMALAKIKIPQNHLYICLFSSLHYAKHSMYGLFTHIHTLRVWVWLGNFHVFWQIPGRFFEKKNPTPGLLLGFLGGSLIFCSKALIADGLVLLVGIIPEIHASQENSEKKTWLAMEHPPIFKDYIHLQMVVFFHKNGGLVQMIFLFISGCFSMEVWKMKMKECPYTKGTISLKEKSHQFLRFKLLVVGRYTLSETNSEFTLKICLLPKRRFHLPTIIFQGAMLVSGKVNKGNKEGQEDDIYLPPRALTFTTE